jgi:alkylation response protein AidB-like acyl-CoA dehydrogenase
LLFEARVDTLPLEARSMIGAASRENDGIAAEGEELRLVLETIRTLERTILAPERVLEWDEKEVFPEQVLRDLLGPAIGLHLVFIPAECGGMGGRARDVYRVGEAMARIDLGLATSFLAVALGSDPIRVGATEEQRLRWLGRVAREGLVVAYGVTEPEAGSNLAALKTRATPIVEDGRTAAYSLTGVKQFISNGGVADLYTILALTPEGPSFFVVERGAPGLSSGPPEAKHGLRSSNTAQVILDEVRVPADQLVGLAPGKGLEQANVVFGFTRLMVASFGLGAGEAALERAVAYSKERRQFGKLLCEHRGYTHKLLLPHAVRLEAARAYIEEVAGRLDAGETPLQTEGSVAKLFATEAGNAAAEAAIQALGGYGYIRGYHVERIKRDVRVTTIYEGASEILEALVYVFRLKQTLRSRGAFYRDPAAALRASLAPGGRDEVAADLVARTADALALAVLELHRHRVSKATNVQLELADRMAEVEHALALCRRAAAGGGEALRAVCRLFASEVAARLASSVTRLVALSSVAGSVLEEIRHGADLEGLAANRAATAEDQDLVVAWLLDK